VKGLAPLPTAARGRTRMAVGSAPGPTTVGRRIRTVAAQLTGRR
jgi:hypothetical protein